ncbi:ADP-heptose:LPS heptosyltransferase [Streptomyces sp. 1222.5]|uniref:glycosyltransferase family 9 protein n=1 Tax=unclassified Streptomyces TaxID=2593676 RepID=UPI00089AE6B9|nr:MULTISPECIES: glycosyltransferase family 9 protein [unclassified Streptomyces]PKW06003.1 ADP-heptose:LPS heptosyltransferase [Streptomyces sp. 5112.2]SED23451.1 ADP-heptose:LPS heptosyltransferase [Streptomyces sp. 1222.5]
MTRTPHPPTVLVLRALGLGDLLAGVPALRGVRRAFPGHRIVLAQPAGLTELALATGAVDAVFPAEAPGRAVPSLAHWAAPAPDVAIDLHGNGPESRDALAALRPRRLLAHACPDGPPWRGHANERDRWCAFLHGYGIPADPLDLRLPPPTAPSPAPGAVLVHPGAASGARRWPGGRYAAVVRCLRAAGHHVVLTGGPGEEALVHSVAERSGQHARDVLTGGLPFAELSALVAGASLVLSGDTGLAHLAVAHGTRSVTLFGPVSPRLWGPPPGPHHLALWKPGPPGDPHGRTPDARLLRLRTGEVAAACLMLLRPVRAEARRPGPDIAHAR